ncbi:MAG TPA: tRNA pseudouridine(55) synthase TruB [Vicinamibacterales bacterium]|jgi:tRNA pseudouridine55 synthase
MPDSPDGLLVIDKPSGPTSHDIVAAVRRMLKISRVGHTGTLDPMASGVLPLVLGRATRLARFLSASRKTYLAHVRLGAATDTYDAEGRVEPVIAQTPGQAITVEEIEAVLAAFRGSFLQTPPPFSAKKVDGVRAYAMAREQRTVRLEPVPVTVYDLALCGRTDEEIRIRVTCSAGFYVRTLAHEIGARLGTGGYLTALRRTAAAGFSEADAIPLAELAEAPEAALPRVVPMDGLLLDMPAARLTAAGVTHAVQGRDLGPADLDGAPPPAWPAWVRLLDEGGRLVGLGEPRGAPAVLHPSVVLK